MEFVGRPALAERGVDGDLTELDRLEVKRQSASARLRLAEGGVEVALRTRAAAPHVEPNPDSPAPLSDQVERAIAREDLHHLTLPHLRRQAQGSTPTRAPFGGWARIVLDVGGGP